MPGAPKVVAITGASGYIGTQLLLHLEVNPNVSKIVAFDEKPLPYPIRNISFYQTDVSEPIDRMLREHQVDTLVHLACPYSHTNSFQNWPEAVRQNLKILNATWKSCVSAGVRHIIFMSSYTVYGAFADSPVPIAETYPIPREPDDLLGQACLAADRQMREFGATREKEADGAKTLVTILRVCTVLGYSDDHERAVRMFPHRFWGVGENPTFQFIHEVDLAQVLEDVIQQEAEGLFNVAGEGIVFFNELADITRRKLTRLPVFLAGPITRMGYAWTAINDRGWRERMPPRQSRSRVERSRQNLKHLLGHTYDGAWHINRSRYSIVMGTGKVKQTLKYRFSYTSLEALNAFVNYSGL